MSELAPLHLGVVVLVGHEPLEDFHKLHPEVGTSSSFEPNFESSRFAKF